jgi:hypothetical protein
MTIPKVTRRTLLGGFATWPLVALVGSPTLLAACGSRPPETPLAHLYGRRWISGAYELYAERYATVQTSSAASSEEAYRVLAQKGVVALDALQSRDVPFFVRVAEDGQAFSVARNVPERLTFRAGMSESERRAAEAAWKKAREHVHTDYEEIRRLDWALTRLLAQLQRIRSAIDEGRREQFRLALQLSQLGSDPKNLPFELPYEVTARDYEEILLLLLERLEADRVALAQIEADIVAVGLTVRATDAGSGSLAANIRKVLLAVVEDDALTTRAARFPENEAERQKLVEDGRALAKAIEASPEYAAFLAEEREKRLAAFGAFLQALDAMTGLPTSRVYRTVLDIWRGDRDYLGYLETVLSLIPEAARVRDVIHEAIERTREARAVLAKVSATVETARSASAKDPKALLEEAASIGAAKGQRYVWNTASSFALERANKQLAFFESNAEVQKVSEMLAQTKVMRADLPAVGAGALDRAGITLPAR